MEVAVGSPYQSQSASGYNSSPPPDDGSTVSTNKITWATIKSKITDPLKTLADAVNTALRTALNITPITTSVNYTTLVGDHLTTIEVTGTTTISLGDAATMVAQAMGYEVAVVNRGVATVTVSRATGANTLNGAAKDIKLAPGQSVVCAVNSSSNGYNVRAAANGVLFDPTDPSKQARFDVSGVTAGQQRALTVPDGNLTLVGTDTTQTLTNKTLTSPTINTPTIVSPTINTGVSQGSAVKHQRFGATNATAATTASTADTTYNWTTPFADANYTPVAIGIGQASTSISSLSIVSFNATGVTVRVTAGNAVAASFTAVHIIAFHD